MAELSDGPRPVTDVSPAAWIESEVGEFGSGVGGLLPTRFESYARILHPADSPDAEPVRWSTVAAWTGRRMHPTVQFAALARHSRNDEPPWDEPPVRGELAAPPLRALCDVLAGHTGTAEHCWFCLWDGWGWIEGGSSVAVLTATTEPDARQRPVETVPGVPPEILRGPRVRLPWREYLLFEGPLDAALGMGHRGPGYFFPQSPNIFWPADRSWYVVTEIDLDSTYVGGSAALVRDLLADSRLEVLPADPADPVGGIADRSDR